VKIEGHSALTAVSMPVPGAQARAKATGSAALPASTTPTAPKQAREASPAPSAATAVAAGASGHARSAPAMSVSDPLQGTAFSGVPQVGTLFNVSGGTLTSHHCTGSVVDSPAGDIVVTAAHCVYGGSGAETDQAFVPEYDNGAMPFGVWDVSAVYVAPQWAADRDPDYDVAFIVVHQSGSETPIQDVVGADKLAIDQPYTALTDVIGYPSDTDQPISCTNYTTEFTSTQLRWDCGGYPDGTSGSPFLTGVDAQTGYGTVDGVIGGYETGGDTPQVSYSVHFGDAVGRLLAQAEASN
jgi:V8-like Glu-specific endopeptidase